jgi:hypothetical protein
MDEQIVAIYVIVDELLQAIHHREDKQCRMRDAEVMTTAIVAALFFSGNYEAARSLLAEPRYMAKMLSKSRFNRRLHRVKPLFLRLFALLGAHWKDLNADSIYIIDTFPVAACDNYRIDRCRLYQGEAYRGYIASKKRYFYGLKIHLLVTKDGQPVELFLTPGADSDVACLDLFDFDLPDGSEVYADRIYNDYLLEDVINETGTVRFEPLRKKNSKRPHPPWQRAWISFHRKRIETTGSLLEQRLPKHIHAVTALGFELKVVLFTLALSFDFVFKVAT